MLIIMIVLLIVSVACMTITANATKSKARTERDMDNARTAISLGIGAGFALYLIASFCMEYNNDLDFWDYGWTYSGITVEGVTYLGAQIVGLMSVADNAVAALFLAISELKGTGGAQKTVAAAPESQKGSASSAYEVDTDAYPSAPQSKIPAWKQVELENKEKN